MAKLESLLAQGLLRGFARETTFKPVKRGRFVGEQSSFTASNGDVYVDQWFAHQRGGGQELVRLTSGEMMTRLYAGGTIDDEELEKLGISGDQVSAKLTESIREAGEKTRLHEDYFPEPDGDWRYQYRVLARIAELKLTLGLEELIYQNNLTFAHYFLISPVR